MKRISILTLVLLCLLSSTVFATIRWHWIGYNVGNTFYFDAATIHYSYLENNKTVQDKNIISYSLKTTLTEQSRFNLEKYMNKDEKNPIIPWKNVAYMITQQNINISNKTITNNSIQCFDEKHVLLFSYKFKPGDAQFQEIMPDTFNDQIYRHVIRYAAEHNGDLENHL